MIEVLKRKLRVWWRQRLLMPSKAAQLGVYYVRITYTGFPRRVHAVEAWRPSPGNPHRDGSPPYFYTVLQEDL